MGFISIQYDADPHLPSSFLKGSMIIIKFTIMFHHVKDLQFNTRVPRPDPLFANLLLEVLRRPHQPGENARLV
jgi:hypothetical protein